LNYTHKKTKKINTLPKKIFIKTFGCQMNEYDSNRIADIAKENNFERTEDYSKIDCYILNTCHIREKASEKVYHDIGRLKKNYKNKKKPFVLITGCVAQAENDEMLRREPYIDAVVGPQSYHDIPKILSNLESKSKRKKFNLTEFDVIKKFDTLNKIVNPNSNISSFITIQEGCDKFCNFCVVPYTRGAEYSRSMKEIIEEAKNIISNGAREIILLGQNVNAYNFTNDNKKIRLSDLISELEKLKNLKRIRYTTSHPRDMTQDLINCHKKSKKLMPFLHLPIQSGSNKILENMNRKHSREEYLSIIDRLLKAKPNMKFSSDFIVGYPGESDEDFNETITLIKKVKFINSFSFIYNSRPGTPASNQKQIDEKTQKRRLILLQNILRDIQIQENSSKVGKFVNVLIENKMKNHSRYFGRSDNFTPVILSDVYEKDIGKVVATKIQKYNRNTLFGIKEKKEREEAA
tara:strand:- start:1563 stop:2951 length:1389 start_codon:yes stop_codon:yes gene_type:complete